VEAAEEAAQAGAPKGRLAAASTPASGKVDARRRPGEEAAISRAARGASLGIGSLKEG